MMELFFTESSKDSLFRFVQFMFGVSQVRLLLSEDELVLCVLPFQGGDPTGTGEGGESVWGKPFKVSKMCFFSQVIGLQFFY